MNRFVRILALGAGFLLLLSSCEPLAQTKPSPEAQKPAAPAAPAAQKAPEAKPKAPEPPPPPAKPQLTLEDIQARRQVEKELERDVDAFYGYVKDRNVEKAVEMTPGANGEALKRQLWDFSAQYSVETYDLKDKKIDFDKKPYRAELSILLTVYENRSVTPKKMPVVSRWEYADGNWLILPTGK